MEVCAVADRYKQSRGGLRARLGLWGHLAGDFEENSGQSFSTKENKFIGWVWVPAYDHLCSLRGKWRDCPHQLAFVNTLLIVPLPPGSLLWRSWDRSNHSSNAACCTFLAVDKPDTNASSRAQWGKKSSWAREAAEVGPSQPQHP